MSKASEWAKRLEEARFVQRAITDERPRPCASFHVSGFGHMWFEVSDRGYPVLRVSTPTPTSSNVNEEIAWADDIDKLKDAARWILDTFGDAAPPPAAPRA